MIKRLQVHVARSLGADMAACIALEKVEVQRQQT
jgi:hypothetical protein